ncbi:MAG TPA: type II toxin-antitoxin system PemK/MazF family toxin [Candidatus Luteococcus avicola]|nr:type II toxin-antitoxin system PemK/MazF family toxin [Candidatus Luteococcus avicola]
MDSLLRALGRVATDVLRQQLRERTSNQRTSKQRTPNQRTPRQSTSPTTAPEPVAGPEGPAYPGDFAGRPSIEYCPQAGRLGDPGEVVWCWVPYEEDHYQGKDRPVLLIGRDGSWLLGLPLTSKDHDRDEAQEARAGRHWMDVGTGSWDSRGRPSEVRLDRIIRVDAHRVRRTGSALDRAIFDQVTEAVLARR